MKESDNFFEKVYQVARLIPYGRVTSYGEIAKYLETTQNSISRHFLWLRDNGYILGEKRSDSKHFRYYVADRVFVLYYQDREIFHGQEYTPIQIAISILYWNTLNISPHLPPTIIVITVMDDIT